MDLKSRVRDQVLRMDVGKQSPHLYSFNTRLGTKRLDILSSGFTDMGFPNNTPNLFFVYF